MAKAKHTFHLQRFFIIFAVVFSLAAVGILVFASQQQTNTQSDAAGSGCNMTPELTQTGSEGGSGSVTYSLRIKNNSKITCKKEMNYVFYNNPPLDWSYSWRFPWWDSKKDWIPAFGYLAPSEKNNIKVTVGRPASLVKGTYQLKIKVCSTTVIPKCDPKPGFSCKVGWSDYWKVRSSDKCDSTTLVYKKT